jgi:hypothetical protein
MSRWNRTNFLKTELVNDKNELDFVNEYFDDCFQITKEIKYYAFENDDVQNPDLLSLKIYGKQDYWWILCKINNIQDVWNDIKPGDIIIVPDISDIEDFYTRIKKKKKDELK